jgi:hypothetical protein
VDPFWSGNRGTFREPKGKLMLTCDMQAKCDGEMALRKWATASMLVEKSNSVVS